MQISLKVVIMLTSTCFLFTIGIQTNKKHDQMFQVRHAQIYFLDWISNLCWYKLQLVFVVIVLEKCIELQFVSPQVVFLYIYRHRYYIQRFMQLLSFLLLVYVVIHKRIWVSQCLYGMCLLQRYLCDLFFHNGKSKANID